MPKSFFAMSRGIYGASRWFAAFIECLFLEWSNTPCFAISYHTHEADSACCFAQVAGELSQFGCSGVYRIHRTRPSILRFANYMLYNRPRWPEENARYAAKYHTSPGDRDYVFPLSDNQLLER